MGTVLAECVPPRRDALRDSVDGTRLDGAAPVEARLATVARGSCLGSTRFASRTPSVFLSFLYNTLSFPLYFPGKTAWKSSNFWL